MGVLLVSRTQGSRERSESMRSLSWLVLILSLGLFAVGCSGDSTPAPGDEGDTGTEPAADDPDNPDNPDGDPAGDPEGGAAPE